jgi:hypothetical protein
MPRPIHEVMLDRSHALRVIAGAFAALALGASPAAAADPVFAAWHDPAAYALAPNGDFEAGLAGWTVAGGAELVADNPQLIAEQAGDGTSLDLPPGSSATSPPITMETSSPVARMFGRTLRAHGRAGASLKVEIVDSSGRAQRVSTVPDNRFGWDVTPRLSLAQGKLRPGTAIRYRFTPLRGAAWRIDDLYVDPRFRG